MVAPDTEPNTEFTITTDATVPVTIEEPNQHTELFKRDNDTTHPVSGQNKIQSPSKSAWMRAWVEEQLYQYGCFLHADAGKVLFVAILALFTFCVGLKSAQIHKRADQLWIQEGGRLEAEIHYTMESLGEIETSTHQLLIQTARDPDASLLTPRALLDHLRVMQVATRITIHMYEIDWHLKDLCYSPSIPEFEAYHIEKIFDNIIPCAIITPLDCFWEGSKLLGPEYPIPIPVLEERIQWKNLNPIKLLNKIKNMNFTFPIQTLEAYFKRAGITTGYMEKPCLDPLDIDCPMSAPNKQTLQPPDVAGIVSNGCSGFASTYMQWPARLMAGGTGGSVGNKAIQSVVQLMSARETYEYWADHYKVHHVAWTPEKAEAVLHAWQRKFSQEVKKMSRSGEVSHLYDYYPFSTASLDDILENYSEMSLRNFVIGFILMVGSAACVMRSKGAGRAALAVAGVLLLALSHAAGLGLCALLGIPFNAWTLQVAPFAAFALGMCEVVRVCGAKSAERAALAALPPALADLAAFLAAAFALSVPALRHLAMQCAVLVVFNACCALVVLPALAALFTRKNVLQRHTLQAIIQVSDKGKEKKEEKSKFHISYYLKTYYAGFIMKPSVKVISVFAYIVIIVASGWSATKIVDGIELKDMVPQDTDEYQFLQRQQAYFGFYNMYAVTKGDFEYPNNQKLLKEYHDQFVRIPNIVKNDDGGPPQYWLSMFRDWLKDLQKTFDDEWAAGHMNAERWYPNASDDAVLAYKLLVQTGHVDNPVDKSLVTHARLVDADDIINPRAFYNYLSAWASNDALAYGASQSSLRPQPKRWNHVAKEFELRIPKSAPLTFAASPFYLSALTDARKATATVAAVRELCSQFEAKGLPNYPTGIPFLYWEQYLHLRPSVAYALIVVIATVFLASAMATLNSRAALITWGSACGVLIQTCGVMGATGVTLSAPTAALAALGVSLGARPALLAATSFVCGPGSNRRRARRAAVSAACACGRALPGAALAVAALALSRWPPLSGAVLHTLLTLLGLSVLNAVLFLPIFLSILGPAAQLPLPVSCTGKYPPCDRARSSDTSRRRPRPRPSPSLTTITEEPASWRSSSARSSLHSIRLDTVTATANIKLELTTSTSRRSRYHHV